ncbi:MAG: hypothetical protein ABIR70_09855 [Bryobacteraceae bacterium]
MSEEQPIVVRPVGSVQRGVLIGLAISVGVSIVTAPIVIPFLGIGLVQLAWVIPMVRNFRRKGETETAKGMVIQAAVVAMLNATCWGVLIVGLSNASFH